MLIINHVFFSQKGKLPLSGNAHYVALVFTKKVHCRLPNLYVSLHLDMNIQLENSLFTTDYYHSRYWTTASKSSYFTRA